MKIIVRLRGGVCAWRDSTLRDGNDLAGEAVNADDHCFTHRMSFTNRLAAKGHAPDLPVFFDRLDRLDAFRLKVYSVYSLAGDLDDALAGDLLPRSLHPCAEGGLD